MTEDRPYPIVGQILGASDPEPPVGTIVVAVGGVEWRRCDGDGGVDWLPQIVVDFAPDPESWLKVAGNYGPVKVIEVGEGEDAW